MKWNHLRTLLLQIIIAYIKRESLFMLQIEESLTQLWSALGELTISVSYKIFSGAGRFQCVNGPSLPV